MLLSIFGDEMSDAMARDVITVCDLCRTRRRWSWV